jgi:hypothetical protein
MQPSFLLGSNEHSAAVQAVSAGLHVDGHDRPGSIDELVPSLTAVVADVVIGCDDPVRQPVIAHELPHGSLLILTLVKSRGPSMPTSIPLYTKSL